jgi:hypothetical protein
MWMPKKVSEIALVSVIVSVETALMVAVRGFCARCVDAIDGDDAVAAGCEDAAALFLRRDPAPARCAARVERRLILNIDAPAEVRRQSLPNAITIIGDRPVRHRAPGCAGFAGREEIDVAVAGRIWLCAGGGGFGRELHQRIETQQRLVDGDVLLRLAGGEKGEVKARALGQWKLLLARV